MGSRKSAGGGRRSSKNSSKSKSTTGKRAGKSGAKGKTAPKKAAPKKPAPKKAAPKNDRYVVKHPDGWAVKAPNASKSSSVHKRQADADKRAKEVVGNLGGGEVRIQATDGKWRDSDTVAPGNDPCPPKDTKG